MRHPRLKKNIMMGLLVLVLSFFGMCDAFAQSTIGTDFWATFMPNSSSEASELNLIATGPRSCSGTITNPNTGWSASFTVTPGLITNVNIPKEHCYNHTSSETPVNIGLHIVATDSISLYASNFRSASFDVTCVLPTPSLGDEYIIQNYPYSTTERCAEMSIVAVENNTVVDITLTCNSVGGHTPNSPFSVTLNAGQCCQVLTATNNEMSGSHVQARNQKKIAVFGGARSTNVPTAEYSFADHVVEQMMPITTWGNHFVVTQSRLRNNDVIRVTSLNNNCQIRKNGALLTTINARETYQFEITSDEPSCYIETTEPAAVFLYLTSQAYGGTNGDPSMVIINPIEQQIDAVTFSTFNSGNSSYHYVNIVTDTDKVSGMRLDGNNIASQFTQVNGNANYSFARIEIMHGSHTLSNTIGRFVAHVYGLGSAQSYAYSVGGMAINLTSQLLIEDIPSSQLPNGYDVCQGEAVHFNLQLNYNMSMANWNFGDGGTSSGCPVTHTYNAPGNYTVTCNVYQLEQGQNVLVATLTSVIHVKPTYQTPINQSACESYSWHGQTYTQSGTYTYHDHSVFGCDSTIVLHLTINHNTTTDLYVETCDDYYWYGQNYTQSGTYQHHLQTSAGCDSLLLLHLTIGEAFSSEETIEACDQYRWRGQTYTQSGTYTETVEVPNGCDSLFVLHLTINESATTQLYETSCGDFEWYGQSYNQSGTYQHHLQTVAGCDSLLVLHLTIGDSFTTDTAATACNAFVWYGQTYTESGQYQHLMQTANGCDSLILLNLTLGHDITVDTIANVCQHFTWYGQTYDESGDYEHLLHTTIGCDSLVILHLTLGDVSLMEEEVTACNSFTWRGHTYTEGGQYSETVTNPDGCDTIFRLNLHLGHDTVGDTVAMTCEPFTWYGQTYSVSGDYEHLFHTPYGCDSLVTLHFTIGDALLHPAEVAQTCDNSYTWRGHTYTTSGVYYDTVAGVAGCDNIYMLNLTIGEAITVELEATACDEYPWPLAPGGVLTESGEYHYTLQTETGCDSIVNLSLVVNHTPALTLNGPTQVVAATNMVVGVYNYYVTDSLSIEPNTLEWVCTKPEWIVTPLGDGYHCRLVVTTIGEGVLKAITHASTGCDTSSTLDINATYFDVDENEALKVNLFPNPAKTKVTIEATDITRLQLMDELGQVLMDYSYDETDHAMLNIGHLPSGVYVVKIMTKVGETFRRLVIAR